MRHTILLVLFAVGCSGSTELPPDLPPLGDADADVDADTDSDADVDTEPKSACGETTYHNVLVNGRVIGPGGSPASGVSVHLEERRYLIEVTQYGAGVTDANGDFSFTAKQIVSVEDCWALLLDYHLVAERGNQGTEEFANTLLFNAIDTGAGVANFITPPLQLEKP
ncbi:MAG: carboxypeptidase-like regulatory domain-containing protein [Myxococcales bacterium]|nr:carboxypeptidase-like regulatory domain-containing protein [Myxococcales bacterium]